VVIVATNKGTYTLYDEDDWFAWVDQIG